jgi:hypothetical protein
MSTVRYFGQAPAHDGTLEAIGAGLLLPDACGVDFSREWQREPAR